MSNTSTSGRIRSTLCLLLCAMIWGTAFVAQSVATDLLEPYTYNACRFLLGFLVLLPAALYADRKDPLAFRYNKGVPSPNRRKLIVGGIFCGLCMFFAGSFQQIGIQYTTAGKSGFITALYIVLVPLMGLFLKRRCSLLILPAIVLAVIGFYLLCIKEGFSINRGDLITLGCSVVFAMHILCVDRYSPQVNPVQLSCMQFLIAGAASWIPALLLESPSIRAIASCRWPILYAGIFSCGVAYTLQIIGQRGLHPAVASLLMSLESVFSVLSGWLILGDILTRRELSGCALVFLAVILAQLPAGTRHLKKEEAV